jgi:hypothetical protein
MVGHPVNPQRKWWFWIPKVLINQGSCQLVRWDFPSRKPPPGGSVDPVHIGPIGIHRYPISCIQLFLQMSHRYPYVSSSHPSRRIEASECDNRKRLNRREIWSCGFNCRRMRAVNLYKEWTCILHAVVPSESLRFHLWWTWQGTCSISKSSTKKRLKKPQGTKTHQQSSTSTQFQAPISLSMFIQQHSVEKLMVESLVLPSQMSSWGPCKARKLVLQRYPTTCEYDGIWWNMGIEIKHHLFFFGGMMLDNTWINGMGYTKSIRHVGIVPG